MDVVFLIGRILLVVPFVQSGLMIHFSRTGVEYARAYGAPAPMLTGATRAELEPMNAPSPIVVPYLK